MLRHDQDDPREEVESSATVTPVDAGSAATDPVDKPRRPRHHVDGAGPTGFVDYFGNCPRSTWGRGERQRRGMIMREKV